MNDTDKHLVGCTNFLDMLMEPDSLFYTPIMGNYSLRIALDKRELYDKFSSLVDNFHASLMNDTKPDIPYAMVKRSSMDRRVIIVYNIGTLKDCTRPELFR